MASSITPVNLATKAVYFSLAAAVFVFIGADAECNVPRRYRQLICHAVKINGAAMTIPLAQTKDQMFFIRYARRRHRLHRAREEKRLRISVSKRLQHFVPAQKLDIDLRERQQ